jgi:transcriptional regulator with GAF, ATPase, and Fis domain/serine/threonine protein kinase/Tfp pilus assembly protein PilF
MMQQIDKYKIVSTLEKGNYAESYKVQGQDSQDVFALKIAREADSELNGLIAREFTILAQFKHKNIVKVFDYGVTNQNRAYFVSEYISGVPIDKHFVGYSKELTKAMLQVLDALIHIHNRNFVHSDLKPEHILYDSIMKRTVLIDFGFSSVKNEWWVPRGTFGYIAPEVLKGLNADQRSDIYSLGVILSEIIFPSNSDDNTFPSYVVRKHASSCRMQENVPKALYEVINGILIDEPALRPTTGDIYETFVKLSTAKRTKKPNINIALPQLPFIDITKTAYELCDSVKVVGRSHVIFGDKGTGKTRLLNELRYKYLVAGFDVLILSAVKTPRLFDAIRDFVGLEKTPEDMESEASIFSELTRLLKGKVESEKRDLAILVDDFDELTSFDQSFARFFGYSIKDSKIALVMTSGNSSEIEKIGFNNYYLRSFRKNELRRLIRNTFKMADDEDFSNWLYAASGGNPLLIDETIEMLHQRNLLYYSKNTWRLRSSEFTQFSYSKKIEDVIVHKIEELDSSSLIVLQILSLYNNPIEPVILAAVAGVHSLDKLEFLKRKELVKAVRVRGRLSYVLANANIGKIVDKAMSLKKQKDLYAQFLKILKEGFGDVPEYFAYIAEFASACGDIKSAFKYWVKAAESREVAFDFERSIRYFKRAMECAKEVAAESFSTLLIKIGRLENRLGQTNDALDAYNEALKHSKNGSECKEIYYNMGLIYQKKGAYVESDEYFKRAISLTKRRNYDYANIMNSLSYNLICSRQLDEADRLLPEAFNIARNVGQSDLTVKILYNKAVLEWFRQEYDRGVKIIHEALEIAQNTDSPHLQAKCLNLLASLYQQKGDFSKAVEIYNRAISLLEISNNINVLIGAITNTALMFISLGKLERAVDSLNRALDNANRIGRTATTSRILDNLGKAHEIKGDFDKALDLYKQAMDTDRAAAEPIYHAARLSLIREEIKRAKQLLHKAARVSDNPQYHFINALIRAYHGKRDLAELDIKQGFEELANGSVEIFGRIECYLDAIEVSYDTKQYDKCRFYAVQALGFLPHDSREYIVVDAILKIVYYLTDKSKTLNIDTNLNSLMKMCCLYDWAHVRRMQIDALCKKNMIESVVSGIDELFKIEEIFNKIGARIEYGRMQQIKDLILSKARQVTAKETQMTNYLKIFHQISDIINNSLGEEDFVERILDILITVTKAQRGALFLFDEGRAILAAGRNMDKHTIDDARKMSRSVAREASKGKGIICSSDVLADARFKGAKSVLLNRIRSIACAPLNVGKKVVGVIYLDSQDICDLFTVRDEDFLRAVTNFVASTIEKSKLFRKIMDENISLKAGSFLEYGNEYLLGESNIMKKIRQKIERVAKTDATVLITGETGCGKGMVARLIHQNSFRRSCRFVSVNCGCLPETLFESELFGYKKGAFTGAFNDKKGLFEEASAGTLFLDEISNAPISTQGKLLEVIEDKKIRRLGETIERSVDVRLISATNRDLQQMISEGSFREDLFYRIGILTIHVRPLRERPADISILANHLLEKFNAQMNRNILGFEKKAFKAMLQHPWPGNVRELQNAIERAVIFAEGEYITVNDLEIKSEIPKYSRKALVDRDTIVNVIKTSKGNIVLTSKVLGISRRTLYRYIKKYDIRVADFY